MIREYGKWGSLCLILLVSAFYDIREHRIPNWWLAGSTGLLTGALWFLESGGTGLSATFLLGFAVRIAVTLLVVCPLFLLRMMGAGDLKLMAVISGFLGFADACSAVGLGFFIGAVWSLYRLLIQKQLRERLFYLFAYFRQLLLTRERIPYYEPSRDGYDVTIPFGVCLFLGTSLFGIWKVSGGL